MIDREQWHLVLKNLEFLAGGWDLIGETGPAEDLRAMLICYLEPELRVRYLYAGEWREGTLLVPPRDDRPTWQIQRADVGGMVDEVPADPDRIRVHVEGTDPPGQGTRHSLTERPRGRR
jgi:hypothetical protein